MIWSDIRIGIRLIKKNRWTVLAIMLSLALGIGSTAAVFNLFDFLVLRAFPVPDTNSVLRIAAVSKSNAISSGTAFPVSNLDFEDLRDRVKSFDGITSIAPEQLPGIITRGDGSQQPRPVLAALVSDEFFSTLHVEPTVGRGFRPDEDRVPGRDAVAVISYALWQREYDGDPGVPGKTLRINGKTFTIIGVAPEAFYGIDPVVRPDIYIPRTMEGLFGNGAQLSDRTSRRLRVLARLKPGVTLAQARDEVARIGAQIQQEHPDDNHGQRMTLYTQFGFTMATSPEAVIGAAVFLALAGLVLAIACVNVVNLLLSTAPARTREMAIRMAMGASRVGVIRQMLIESALVSVGGVLTGLVFASLFAEFIRSIEIFSDVPIRLDLQVDNRVAWFALVIGLAAGVVSGLIPAIRCSRSDLNSVLKSTETRTASHGRIRFRRLLVAAQVAVAVFVLVLSGFSFKQLQVLRRSDPGFRVDHVWRAAFFLAGTNDGLSYRKYLERIRRMPGVHSVAAAYPEPLMLPGLADEATNLTIEGYTLPADQTSIQIRSAVVSEDFFETLDIPILRGRAFDERDIRENRSVAIINETMAAKYWPAQNAIGKRIRPVGASGNGHEPALEIIGVARNAKYRSVAEEAAPYLYRPMAEKDRLGATLLVWTDADSPSFDLALRRELSVVDPNTVLPDIGTMAQHVRQQSLLVERIMSQVMTIVAAIGLLLSVIGLYGVVAYSVTQRTHEIGIRMAVGASSGRVLRMVLWEGLKVGIAGTAAGGLLASQVMQFAKDVLNVVNPLDPPIYAAAIGVSAAVTLLACYLPARRASLIDPNVTLRCE
jgi:predicted permease